MIDTTAAFITITGIAPMILISSHNEPKLGNESHNDYDIRTWRHKLNTETRDGRQAIVIPAHSMQQCIASAAKYSKRQPPGQGKATWTAKIKAGIMLFENPALDRTTIGSIAISTHAKGVLRKLPVIQSGWASTFLVNVLDPIITGDVFREMLEFAGMFIGLGHYRPQYGGTNGRFTVSHLEWQDYRRKVA